MSWNPLGHPRPLIGLIYLSNLSAGPSTRAVCGCLPVDIVVSNLVGGMDVCLSVVSVVCCQVEVSASGRSLVQRGTNVCWLSNECDLETSTKKSPRPTEGCRVVKTVTSVDGPLTEHKTNHWRNCTELNQRNKNHFLIILHQKLVLDPQKTFIINSPQRV
jgi:hypothetical protein